MEDSATQSEQDKCAEIQAMCAALNIPKASRAMSRLFDDVLQPSGLRVTQFALLVTIRNLGSATITQLADELIMNRTTVARKLASLESNGLVAIASGRDRRQRIATLTAEGDKALAEALPRWEEAQSRVVERLGEESWSDLVAELSTIMLLSIRSQAESAESDPHWSFGASSAGL